MAYTLTHSVECPVGRGFAWAFWSEVGNWARVDPAVASVCINGPFAAGTRGETRQRAGAPVEWKLVEVSEGRGAVVEIRLPGASVKFAWAFEESGDEATRITQRVTLEGVRAEDYAEGLKTLGREMPSGMSRLAEAMSKAAREAAR